MTPSTIWHVPWVPARTQTSGAVDTTAGKEEGAGASDLHSMTLSKWPTLHPQGTMGGDHQDEEHLCFLQKTHLPHWAEARSATPIHPNTAEPPGALVSPWTQSDQSYLWPQLTLIGHLRLRMVQLDNFRMVWQRTILLFYFQYCAVVSKLCRILNIWLPNK
jgi:hypothetical protein